MNIVHTQSPHLLLQQRTLKTPLRFHRIRCVSVVSSLQRFSEAERMSGGEKAGMSMVVKPPSHPTYDLRGVIELALSEDAGDRGDVTSLATIPQDAQVEAHFLAKEDGVVAGIALAEMVFQQVDPSLKVEWSQKDGDCVRKGLKIGKVNGTAYSIIVAERVVLNFMQRMSGIATLTKAMAEAAHPAIILETRKTAPGLRLIDKWAIRTYSYRISNSIPNPSHIASVKDFGTPNLPDIVFGQGGSSENGADQGRQSRVLIGGGRNHRMGLFDMVLIKDNHISAAGGITNAVKSVDLYLEQNNLSVEVEVETRTLEEVQEVLHYASQTKTSLTRIMLDNMVVPLSDGDVDVSMLKEAVKLINGRFETEASGNVTLDTVNRIGGTGVTYISSGALTHSVKALDISLKIDTELALQVGKRTKRA